MFSHLPVLNLIGLQQLRSLDLQIAEEHKAGYTLEVDRLLDARLVLVEQLRRASEA